MKKAERQAIAEAIRQTVEVLQKHPRRHHVSDGALLRGWAWGNLLTIARAVERGGDHAAVEWVSSHLTPPEETLSDKEEERA